MGIRHALNQKLMSNIIVIAEAGVNHNGDIEKAYALVDAAKDAGADFVKFQTFKAENIVSKKAKKAAYQKKNLGTDDDFQFEMLKKLELSEGQHNLLSDYCRKKGIYFFSTAFDVDGLHYLNSNFGFDRFKIPSGEITNYPYLKTLASFGKPIILSTGMANMEEIGEAIEVLCSDGLSKEDITVLHCNTEYPTPMQDVNLKAMLSIGQKYEVKIGYSDHTLGIEVPIAAVAMGATVIEKHFTLDRSLPGPDHRASLEPNELKQMVDSIRNIEVAISGSGKKTPSESEARNMEIVRKSLHLNKNLKKGTVISSNDLVVLRPATGISPMRIEEVVGKSLTKDVQAYDSLKEEDIS
jgi:N,N'-diacetyllegionaminate synthase